ncbi:hypothetical protein A3D71_00825 [Candidatus Kaiserbacteria bacterium RIFCSPHIGHO2_02_FULL_55_20]|uniref:Uncharacterized protein n=1 Tax=Candidatus Kaiserbacteria bacterium RIFCSPHIGHO2_02_FULL_55_20 TaxID=1798497 RepID=A0A1F6DW90_9BACT|nr:MAG: hypothetical protein A2680_02515 [Candidatus Kaiserbacteria bacterium RIFCSPHIGHO2_01_FULL_55_37]OGG65705.1 MAG: hypothetical protein A3D71_00825 [Candidatus Kaiserbacteria bacterium RIFCSPHIGHO2_02_FULL_55_20]
MDTEHDQQQEIYRLVKENNRMLHSMRRNALWGGIFKFIFWAIIFIAPLWFYMTYLAPVVQDMVKTVQQVQGTSAKAQAQFGSFQEMLKQLQQKFPSAQ